MQVLHRSRGQVEAVAVTTLTSTEAMFSTSSSGGGSSTSSKDEASAAAASASSALDAAGDVVYQTVYACQDETLKISCLDDYSVKVVRANYGRFSIAICNDVGRADFSVNCHSPATLNILQQRFVS